VVSLSPPTQCIHKSNSSSRGWLVVGLNAALTDPAQRTTNNKAVNGALCINLCTHSWPMRFMRCVLHFFLVLFFSFCCCFAFSVVVVAVGTPTKFEKGAKPKQNIILFCLFCFFSFVHSPFCGTHVFRSKAATQAQQQLENLTKDTRTVCRSRSEVRPVTFFGFWLCEGCQWSEALRPSVRLETAPEVDAKRRRVEQRSKK